jgi:23S rRNA (adenine2503-C2)-methyltransferase
MIRTAQKNIRHLSLMELEQYFETINEKKFRARQVWEWLWQKHAQSFGDMTNLSKELRQKLGEHFTLPCITLTQHNIAQTEL